MRAIGNLHDNNVGPILSLHKTKEKIIEAKNPEALCVRKRTKKYQKSSNELVSKNEHRKAHKNALKSWDNSKKLNKFHKETIYA